jgi:glycosyltransferase involved in cell wall biosynthesis
LISVIIPAGNSARTIGECLDAVVGSDYRDYECIVVDDGSTDGSFEVAQQYPVRAIRLNGNPHGPAYARNRGAEIAKGDLLVFLDADVLVRPDTLTRVVNSFSANGHLDAMFGSYDEEPQDGGFLSQYKNLFHHFVHQQGREEASTFWSGCGAIRREVFLAMGGFDEKRYSRPSIEDIELGLRLKARNGDIHLNKDIQVKHLKRWTLWGLIKSEILDRGIPWTSLILRSRKIPDDLNLRLSQRASAILMWLILLNLGITAFFHEVALLPLLGALFVTFIVCWDWNDGPGRFVMSRRAQAFTYLLIGTIAVLAVFLQHERLLAPLVLVFVATVAAPRLTEASALWRRAFFATMVLAVAVSVVLLVSSFSLQFALPLLGMLLLLILLNHRFYSFFVRKRGVIFTLAVVPFHLLYFVYSTLAFAAGVFLHLWNVTAERAAGSATTR